MKLNSVKHMNNMSSLTSKYSEYNGKEECVDNGKEEECIKDNTLDNSSDIHINFDESVFDRIDEIYESLDPEIFVVEGFEKLFLILNEKEERLIEKKNELMQVNEFNHPKFNFLNSTWYYTKDYKSEIIKYKHLYTRDLVDDNTINQITDILSCSPLRDDKLRNTDMMVFLDGDKMHFVSYQPNKKNIIMTVYKSCDNSKLDYLIVSADCLSHELYNYYNTTNKKKISYINYENDKKQFSIKLIKKDGYQYIEKKYKNGKLNAIDEPSYRRYSTSAMCLENLQSLDTINNLVEERYHKDNELHRDYKSGPAIIKYDKDNIIYHAYYENNKLIYESNEVINKERFQFLLSNKIYHSL